MENLPLIEDTSRFDPLIEKFASLKKDYGDEYPIIFFEPNIETEAKKVLKDLILENPSIHLFSEFEKAFEFVESLGTSFILIFSSEYNEQMMLQAFQDLKYTSKRMMFDFEEEALLKNIFKDISESMRKSLKVHVFMTLLDANTELPVKEDEEEVMVMCDPKEMTNKFREEPTIIWYDPCWTSEMKETITEKVDIEERNTYTDFGELYQRISSSSNSPYHLILTGKDEAEKIMAEINNFKDLLGLYVYCDDPGLVPIKNRKTAFQKNFKDLIPKIVEGLRTRSKLHNTFPAFATHFDALDKSDNYKLHYYLKGFVNFQNRKQAKRDFLQLAKNIYQSKKMLEFEQDYNDYNKNEILKWYTIESPVYKLLNNCLRIATSDSILYCRYVLKDLEMAIRDHYQKDRHNYNGLVYRGAYISDSEWKTLQNNVNKEIEMYGFLSTSQDIKVAERFLNYDADKKALITIIIPPLPVTDLDEQGFANMTQSSGFNEEEILFNVRSKFKILEANHNGQSRHLVLLYGAHLLRRSMTESKQSSIAIEFTLPSNTKCDTCGSAEKLFGFNLEAAIKICCIDCLRKDKIPSNTPILAVDGLERDKPIVKSFNEKLLPFNQGVTFPYYGYKCQSCQEAGKGKYYKWLAFNGREKFEQCSECFENKAGKELDILFSEENPYELWQEEQTEWEEIDGDYQTKLSESAKYHDQNEVYMRVEQFNSSVKYLKDTICKWSKKRFREKRKMEMLTELGHAYQKLENKQQALEYGEKALEINKALFGEQDPLTAESYNQLAVTYRIFGRFQKALKYHQKGLKICKKVYGEKNPRILKPYSDIVGVLNSLGAYEEGKQLSLEALEFAKMIYGEKHPEIAVISGNLAAVLNSLGEHKQALEYLKQGKKIYRAVYGERHPYTAILYINLASVYGNLKEDQLALKYSSRALKTVGAISEENNSTKAKLCSSLASASLSFGRHQEAIEHLLKALDITKVIYGEIHPDPAELYNKIAFAYSKLGKHQKTFEFYQKAFQIYKSLFGEIHPNTASSYNSLASVYSSMAQYEQAREYYEKAFEINKSVYGEKHPCIADSYNHLALLASGLGKHPQALTLHKKALKIRKAICGKEHPDTALSYTNISLVYQSLGKFQQAMKDSLKSLEIRKEIYGGKHPEVAESHQNLASVYSGLGKHPQALEHNKTALEIYKGIYGEKHQNVAASYHKTASVYLSLGEHQKALEENTKALEIFKNIYGEKHPNVATSYDHLASVQSSLGDNQKALEYLKKSLEIKKEIYGENHPETAMSYQKIAEVFSNLQKHQEALKYHEESRNIREVVYGQELPSTAASYNNIASAYIASKEYQKALEYYEKAFKIFTDMYGKNHPFTADLYNNIGIAYSDLGKHQQALESYQKALEIRKSIYGEKHLKVAESYKNLASAYHKLKDISSAFEYKEKAQNIVRNM